MDGTMDISLSGQQSDQEEERPEWNHSTPSAHLRNRQGHGPTSTSLPLDEDIPSGSSTSNKHHNVMATSMTKSTFISNKSDGESMENSEGHCLDTSSTVLVDADDAGHSLPLHSVSSASTATATTTTTTTTTMTTATTTTTIIPANTIDATSTTTNLLSDSVTSKEKEPSSSTKSSVIAPAMDSESNAEFSCNICFDTSISPVLTLCGHLFCWPCLHQWLDAQRQNPTCPVCKAGCAQDNVIPIYGRGREQVDPRSTTPKRPAGQRPEPLRNLNQPGFNIAAGQVTFSGPFTFTPFGIQYGGSYTTTIGGPGGVAQTPMQAYISRMFFMLGTLILVAILLY